MVDDIKPVLASMPPILIATRQVHKYSRPLKTLTHKGRHLFVNFGLLVFEIQTLHNPGGYPIPFRIGIKCREHRHNAFSGAMQMKLVSIWCLHC
jgi:hypothetical protein